MRISQHLQLKRRDHHQPISRCHHHPHHHQLQSRTYPQAHSLGLVKPVLWNWTQGTVKDTVLDFISMEPVKNVKLLFTLAAMAIWTTSHHLKTAGIFVSLDLHPEVCWDVVVFNLGDHRSQKPFHVSLLNLCVSGLMKRTVQFLCTDTQCSISPKHTSIIQEKINSPKSITIVIHTFTFLIKDPLSFFPCNP